MLKVGHKLNQKRMKLKESLSFLRMMFQNIPLFLSLKAPRSLLPLALSLFLLKIRKEPKTLKERNQASFTTLTKSVTQAVILWTKALSVSQVTTSVESPSNLDNHIFKVSTELTIEETPVLIAIPGGGSNRLYFININSKEESFKTLPTRSKLS